MSTQADTFKDECELCDDERERTVRECPGCGALLCRKHMKDHECETDDNEPWYGKYANQDEEGAERVGIGYKFGGYGSIASYWGSYARRAEPAEELLLAGRLAEQMVGFAAGERCAIKWEDGTPHTGLLGKTVTLNPKPIVEATKSHRAQDDLNNAKTVVMGWAYHEGLERAHSPSNFPQRVEKFWIDKHQPRQPGELIPTCPDLFRACEAMVNDHRIEAKGVRDRPGFTGYLDAGWEYISPPAEIVKHLETLRQAPLEVGFQFAALQALSRTYRPHPPEVIAALGMLNENQQHHPQGFQIAYQVLAVGQRILRQARDADKTFEDGLELAWRLYKLLTRHEVPQDQQGQPTPSPEELGGLPGPGGQGGPPIPGKISGPAPSQAALDAAEILVQNLVQNGKLDLAPHQRPGQALSPQIAQQIQQLEELEFSQEEREGVDSNGFSFDQSTTYTHTTRRYKNAQKYNQYLAHIKPLVPAMARALKLRAVMPIDTRHALKVGRLDNHALHRVPGTLPGETPAAFMRSTILQAPDVHIKFLVDESSSMSQLYSNVYSALALCLEGIKAGTRAAPGSIDYSVTGFTDGGSIQLKHVIKGWRDDPSRIMQLHASNGTPDGPAIAWALEWLIKTFPYKQKVLMFVADGEGTDNDPIATAVRNARKKGVTAIGIYINGHAQHRDWLERWGAEGHGWIAVPNVRDLPRQMSRILERALRW